MTQAKAHHELSKLRMEGGHIDEYIAKFKQYVTMAGYSVDEPTVLEKFIKGLPNPLARTCVEMDTPDTWEVWWITPIKENKCRGTTDGRLPDKGP